MSNPNVQVTMTLLELSVLMGLADYEGASAYGVTFDPIKGSITVGVTCDQLMDQGLNDPPQVRPVMEVHQASPRVFRRLDWDGALAPWIKPVSD